MKKVSFPYCCTMKILCDFGETIVSEGGMKTNSVEQIVGYLESEINSYSNENYAMLVATTNSEQIQAIKALKQVGFKSTKWVTKNQHSGTKVKLWWYPLNG